MSTGDQLIVVGSLPGGRQWCVSVSNKQAVEEGEGMHYILHFFDDPPADQVSPSERAALLGSALAIAVELSEGVSPGRFRIELNGPAAASRPHFHVHIICVREGVPIRHATDSIVAVREG